MGRGSRGRSAAERVTVSDARDGALDSLLQLARARLPVAVDLLEGVRDAGVPLLRPDMAARFHYSCSLARLTDQTVGFAWVAPFELPGGQGRHPGVANLTYLVADEAHSGKQIGQKLLLHAAARRKAMGAHMIIAHIPSEARSLYERAGWTVLAPERGLAWQAPGGILLADYSTSGPPFVHFAYKQLGELAYQFTFEHIGAPPVGRAAAALLMGSYEGNVDRSRMSLQAIQQVAMAAAAIQAEMTSQQ
jgi:GNAT superfamily N-acetyltransferase